MYVICYATPRHAATSNEAHQRLKGSYRGIFRAFFWSMLRKQQNSDACSRDLSRDPAVCGMRISLSLQKRKKLLITVALLLLIDCRLLDAAMQ